MNTETTTPIPDRLTALRRAMQAENIAACIIPSSDAHQNEYVADHWKTRQYFSGFTGSAGTLVVTHREAHLWTDSRYFLQAENELTGTGISLQKEKSPGTPTPEEWLSRHLVKGDTIGIDATVFSIDSVASIEQQLLPHGLSLATTFDPLPQLWHNRPPAPETPVFILPETFAGESADSKIARLRAAIRQDNRSNALLLCAPDEIAWLFNIRGSDIPCNPVTIARALITDTEAVLFIHRGKLNEEVSEYLRQHHIRILDYDALPHYLSEHNHPLNIRLDTAKTNRHLYDLIRNLSAETNRIQCTLQSGISPVSHLKSVKNKTEIAGFRSAMEKDGVALVQLLIWLEHAIANGNTVYETDIATKIRTLRAQQPLYFGESFDTIAACGAHGAIVHYHATEACATPIRPESLLLIDTGGHYFDGTTDITRTIAIGTPTAEMMRDFTLVLKGHIAIATVRFPQGTRGAQLDVLARHHLWHEGLTYLHGTGHGVGHFLNVHEGPQHIRLEDAPVPLRPGMVTSNEPGLYRAERYGIRIENLTVVREDTEENTQTEFGAFYRFETLTLCPVDTRLILPEMLSASEKSWLNNYHYTVYQRLSPRLSEDERRWLKEKTAAI
jgi:Xaa-Pro aminopeptidase